MSDSDEQLLDRVRRGDEAAFERLFLRHYGQVYRLLYSLMADHQQAEDLAQETFLALLHRPPTPEASAGLLAWLCRVRLLSSALTIRGYALRSQ